MLISEFFETIRSIPGTTAKVAYAKEHHNQLIDQIVADAMDPSITYGVTSKDVGEVTCSGIKEIPDYYRDFHALLAKFAKREITGNAAVEAIRSILSFIRDDETRELLKQVLDRDLKMGISWKTWRAEVLGISEKFEVALAQHLEKVKGVNPVNGTYYASRKCDGCVSGDTLVEIEGHGVLPISEVVDKKLQGKIKSYDVATGRVVYSDITDWMHNVPDADPGQKEWFLLELKDGRSLKITGNDSLYVKGKGWVRVDALAPGDELAIDSI
jgi:hypothetical protein